MITRRQFVSMSVAAFAVGHALQAATAAAESEGAVIAGPASNYEKDGIYDKFHNDGFFILRRGAALLAISSYCTHRKCRLTAQHDHTFYCKCHGSTFDPDGKVTAGPAHRDLPFFATAIDLRGQLLVFPKKIVGLTH